MNATGPREPRNVVMPIARLTGRRRFYRRKAISLRGPAVQRFPFDLAHRVPCADLVDALPAARQHLQEGARRPVYLIDRCCGPIAHAPLVHLQCTAGQRATVCLTPVKGAARVAIQASVISGVFPCRNAFSGASVVRQMPDGQRIAKQSVLRGAQTVSSSLSMCAMVLPERHLRANHAGLRSASQIRRSRRQRRLSLIRWAYR